MLLARAESRVGGAYLVELSGLDAQGGLGRIVFYTLYLQQARARLVALALPGRSLRSVDSSLSSAGWLERELSELLGVPLEAKADSRNLLLDYSLSEAPLRRSFPCSGYLEVSYSALAGGLVYAPTSPVDL